MMASLDPVSISPSTMTVAGAVGAGLLASLNVCAVVRLPIVAAYVMGAGVSRKRALVLAVLLAAGLAAGTVLLGQTASATAQGVPKTLQVSKYVFSGLGVGLIAVGVLISGLVPLPLVPAKCRRVAERLVRMDVPGALLLGLVLGLLQTPACPACRAQLLTVVQSAPAGGVAPYAFLLLAGFAAGQSLVTLSVGLLAALLKPGLVAWLRTRMCSIEGRMQLLTGDMLVVLGIYFVIVG